MVNAQEYFENTFSINRETIEYYGWSKSDQEKLEGTSVNLANNSKLSKMSLADCSIKQDLSIFSHLKNLEYLNINKTPLFGSLKVLVDTKLKTLCIKKCPNIKEGWEFLPNTLKEIDKDRDDLFWTLTDYKNNFPTWRKDHDFLIGQINELEKKLSEQEILTSKILGKKEQLEKQLANEKQTFLTTAEKLNNYISQLEEQLANLQTNKQEAKIEIFPK